MIHLFNQTMLSSNYTFVSISLIKNSYFTKEGKKIEFRAIEEKFSGQQVSDY